MANIFEQQGLGSHVQLRTHPDNLFPVYIPSHDSCDFHHFDSPVERLHFEEVAGIVETGVLNVLTLRRA